MTPTTQRETREAEVARQFPDDIARHHAKINLNEGVYRHIVCREPGTFNRAFNVTTWPGHLAITGDMGSFVFTRLHDMFEFFRRPDGGINSGYWAEKLCATDKSGGHSAFDGDVFREAIEHRLTEWLEGRDTDTATELRERVADDVLSCADDGADAAYRAAYEFGWEGEQVFTDFWETNCREYTHHFLWCCHAIVWAIAQWDSFDAPSAEDTP